MTAAKDWDKDGLGVCTRPCVHVCPSLLNNTPDFILQHRSSDFVLCPQLSHGSDSWTEWSVITPHLLGALRMFSLGLLKSWLAAKKGLFGFHIGSLCLSNGCWTSPRSSVSVCACGITHTAGETDDNAYLIREDTTTQAINTCGIVVFSLAMY